MGAEVVGQGGELGGVAAERSISSTVKMTRRCGAWALICRARVRVVSNWGRTRTRVLIFSEKTRLHPAAPSASS